MTLARKLLRKTQAALGRQDDDEDREEDELAKRETEERLNLLEARAGIHRPDRTTPA